MKQLPITSLWSIAEYRLPIIHSFDIRILLTDHRTRRQRVLLPIARLLRKVEVAGIM